MAYYYQNRQYPPSTKTPSVVLYEVEDERETLISWGTHAAGATVTSIPPPSTSTQSRIIKRDWFKILLHMGYLKLYQDRHERVEHRDVKRWVRDYLKSLYEWIKADITKTLYMNDWSSLQVVFAFAAPDQWSLDDRSALSDFNSCIGDAGFLTGGSKHRILMTTEAVAAASYFSQTGSTGQTARMCL